MSNRIYVNTACEIDSRLEQNDRELAIAITNSILKSIRHQRDTVHLVEVYVDSDRTTYDIEVDRKDCLQILKQNLELFISLEEYERCIGINDGISKLELENSN